MGNTPSSVQDESQLLCLLLKPATDVQFPAHQHYLMHIFPQEHLLFFPYTLQKNTILNHKEPYTIKMSEKRNTPLQAAGLFFSKAYVRKTSYVLSFLETGFYVTGN